VGFELRFFWRDVNHLLGMAWGDPSHPYLGFLMEDQEGCKGQRQAHSFICSPREFGEEKKDEDGDIR
jgi:hypothetical protein